jgi:hypothetical protein
MAMTLHVEVTAHTSGGTRNGRSRGQTLIERGWKEEATTREGDDG